MSGPPSEELRQDGGAQTASQLGPGSILGKYRISKRLGEGGMGVVFAAVHTKLGRSVAIKVLRRELCTAQEQLLRFQREAELVTRIGHPNIVAVYDFGHIGDGSLYYVMELLSGESMRSRLNGGPLSEAELIDLFTQLLSAVRAAHEVGAVHRDLKPENVQLVPAGPGEPPQVKLLDFGVAKIKGDKSEAPPPEGTDPGKAGSSGSLAGLSGDGLTTEAGTLMGTPAYMAPEQIKGSDQIDLRADLYAIGVLLFEALLGKRPFNGSVGELMGKHLYEEVPAPSVVHVEEKLPPRTVDWNRLDALIAKALAKKPEDRYPDGGALLADLEAALGRRRYANMQSLPDLSRLAAAESLANKRARRNKLLKRIGAGVAAAAVIGGIAFLSLRSPSELPEKPVNLGAARQRASELIKAARQGDAESQRRLYAAVALTHARPLWSAVEDGLESDQPEVWREAVKAARVTCKPTDEGLRESLISLTDQAVGAAAVDVATARQLCGDPAAKAVLTALASSRTLDALTRLQATLAMAKAGQAPATALRGAFGNALRAGSVPADLRRSALVQLLVMNDAEAERQVNEAAGKKPSEAQGDEKALRIEAIAALALAKKPHGGDLLYSAARQAFGEEHVELSLLLAEAGDKWALKLVQPLLKDTSPKLRARAAAALGWLAEAGSLPNGQSGLIAAVEPLLKDTDPQVALTAAVLVADEETVKQSAPPRPAETKQNQETEAP